jgi:hypothetical protein
VISDVTAGESVEIHLEPGLWVIVPPANDPAEGSTVARMASSPDGTTINAQGTFRTFGGPPTIPSVDMTPFVEGSPSAMIRFASQTATNHGTPRIPQDLLTFILDGKITQAMLDDPNSVLRDHIKGLNITETTATFWIEKVEHQLVVPPFRSGQGPLLLKPEPTAAG